MVPLGYYQVMISTKVLGRLNPPAYFVFFFLPLLDSFPVYFKILLCHHLTQQDFICRFLRAEFLLGYNEHVFPPSFVCLSLFYLSLILLHSPGRPWTWTLPPLTDRIIGVCHYSWFSCSSEEAESDTHHSYCFISLPPPAFFSLSMYHFKSPSSNHNLFLR